MGGLRIDARARVLREPGAGGGGAGGGVIAGLLAAGEVTGGVHGGNRLGTLGGDGVGVGWVGARVFWGGGVDCGHHVCAHTYPQTKTYFNPHTGGNSLLECVVFGRIAGREATAGAAVGAGASASKM